MGHQPKEPPPIVYILMGLVLVGGGSYLYFGERGSDPSASDPSASDPSPSAPATPNTVAPAPSPAAPSTQISISSGERLLIQAEGSQNPDFLAAKQAGISAYAAGNNSQAAAEFDRALQLFRNAPETVIYRNNARIGTQTAYTLAVSVPIEASTLNFALEMLRGFAQAQTEINDAGGINGVPLKLIIADDDDNPAVATQVVQNLAQDPEILGVMGHWSSDTTLATLSVYTSEQLVLVNPTSTSPEISGQSEYVFRTIPSNLLVGRALADYLLNDLGSTQVAVFYDSGSEYSNSLKSEFTTSVLTDGGQVVAEFRLDDAAFDPGQALEQILSQGVEAISLVPAPNTVDRALQVVTVNQGRLQLLGDIGNLYSLKTLQVGGANAVGLTLVVPWHIDSDPGSAFVINSRQTWGGDVNWATAVSYDAAQVMIAALRTNPTRAGIQQVLSESGFEVEGATGRVRFSAIGDRLGGVQLLEVQATNPSRSGTGYDFIPINP